MKSENTWPEECPWPKGDDRRFYTVEEIPENLMEEIRAEISDADWDYFLKNEECVIKRDQCITLDNKLQDYGWGLFITIR